MLIYLFSGSSRQWSEEHNFFVLKIVVSVPGWRNGRRCGLKIRCPLTDVWVRIPPSVPALFTFIGLLRATNLVVETNDQSDVLNAVNSASALDTIVALVHASPVLLVVVNSESY